MTEPVCVSRRINVPAARVFAILADPARHPDIDGSGMLREAISGAPVRGVGDTFGMRMHNDHMGDYEMLNYVVEYEQDRRVGWEPEAGRGHPSAGSRDAGDRWGHRWTYELTPDGPDATIVTERYDCSRAPTEERAGMEDGAVWIEAMTDSLERLAKLCGG